MKTDPTFKDNLNYLRLSNAGLVCPGSEATTGCSTVELARIDEPTYWIECTNEETDHAGFVAAGGSASGHMQTVRIHFQCSEHGDFNLIIHGFASAAEHSSGAVLVMTEGPQPEQSSVAKHESELSNA